jgi:hypothetical protein
MDVVDMGKGQQPMQRRVDRSRARIEAEGAMREIADHLVVVGRPAIVPLDPQQPLLIKGGEAVQSHRAEIAARSLDPQHRHRFTRERIDPHELG